MIWLMSADEVAVTAFVRLGAQHVADPSSGAAVEGSVE